MGNFFKDARIRFIYSILLLFNFPIDFVNSLDDVYFHTRVYGLGGVVKQNTCPLSNEKCLCRRAKHSHFLARS